MHFKKGALAILLVLAMVTVAFAAILPVAADVTLAEDGEIEDYRYQTVTGTNVKTSEETDLRFLFSIDETKLNDYTAVGFVFSKSDDPVKVDSPKVNYKEVTAVYSAVIANSEEIPAPDGRYWVAIKLSDIPHASFTTEIYVRPFVEDGEGTRYGETTHINVCKALGHTHEASLLCPHCDGCDLDVEPTVNVKECNDSSKTGEKEYIPEEFIIRSVQGYDATNPDTANDLLMEFSILWNPTMLNLDGTVEGSEGPYCATRIYSIRSGKTRSSNLTYWSGSDEPKASWCPYAGGFEGAEFDGGQPAGMGTNHGAYSNYPNIGGSVAAADADNLENGHEWGWHRVGVRVHQEVSNLAALIADTEPGATAPTYRTTVTVYFDGEEVFSVYGDYGSNKVQHRLYTVASNGDGTVTYTPIADDVKAIPFVLHSRRVKSDTAAYVVTADISVTCGTEFVQDVERAADPTVATIAPVGYGLPTNVYYQFKND